MENEKLKKVIDIIDDKVQGVNKECIIEFYNTLKKYPIDLSSISIGWVISNIIIIFMDGADINTSLSSSFVDRGYFEMIFKKRYGFYNPLVYNIAFIAANGVKSKLVTKESKYEYLNRNLKVLLVQYNESNMIKKHIIKSQSEWISDYIKKVK